MDELNSGQQEDKPLTRTEYYEANPPKPEDQLKGIATDSKPTTDPIPKCGCGHHFNYHAKNKASGWSCSFDGCNCGGYSPTDSKPDKAFIESMQEATEIVKAARKELTDSEPDQLREILSNLPEIEQKPYYDAIQALISQREQASKIMAADELKLRATCGSCLDEIDAYINEQIEVSNG